MSGSVSTSDGLLFVCPPLGNQAVRSCRSGKIAHNLQRPASSATPSDHIFSCMASHSGREQWRLHALIGQPNGFGDLRDRSVITSQQNKSCPRYGTSLLLASLSTLPSLPISLHFSLSLISLDFFTSLSGDNSSSSKSVASRLGTRSLNFRCSGNHLSISS